MVDAPASRRGRGEPGNGSGPGVASKGQRRTRSEDLLCQLESDILNGVLRPGTRLDEQALAARFKVSRTPVREALWHLGSSGLVQIRPHQGAVVTQLTVASLLEMFQVMAELEGLCARLAARRMSREERAELRAIHERCSECASGGDEDGFFQGNVHLHDAICVSARNRFLLQQVRDLRKRLNPYRRILTHQPGVMPQSVEEHEQFVCAIENGDGPAAHDVMRSHLNMLGAEACDLVAALSTDEQHLGNGPEAAAKTTERRQSPVREKRRSERPKPNRASGRQDL